jgi:ABC-type sugar transport system permease subunit
MTRQRSQEIEGYLLLAPAILIVLFIIIYPTVYSVYLSTYFHKIIRLKDRTFVGIENYVELFSSGAFWNAILTGLIFTFSSVSTQLFFGLIVALLLNHKKLIWRTFFKGLVILPWLIPVVAVALIWKWMLNDFFGIINHFLKWLGLVKDAVPWLAQPRLAMASLVVTNLWRGLPLVVVMLLAGLQGIPEELYEVAQIDGASRPRMLFSITLPFLKPVIMIVAILRTIWNFNFFDLPFILTQGGPAGATTTAPIYAYIATFSGHRLGFGATIAVSMFVILLIMSFIYLKLGKIE